MAMAGGWAGFSEQELLRLQGQRSGDMSWKKRTYGHPEIGQPGQNVAEPPLDQPRQLSSVNKGRQHLPCKKAVRQIYQRIGQQDGAPLAPPEQCLSVPKLKPSLPQASPPPSQPLSTGEQQNARNLQEEPGLEKPCNVDQDAETNHKLVKKKMELQEKSRWEVLQKEQKLMEEKNKRKKALLAKAIAERSKKTQAETVKLKRIQNQLQALDDMVSADIGILRNRIDQASLDYSYARKRYDKAEVEYVAAKLDLQKKTEIKEQLTEHLCTIIQQNELRKATKLEELMQQLEVEADEENLELEIEVEQMLQQQEGEAASQVTVSQKLAPVGGENEVSQSIEKECEKKDHPAAVSEQLVEQSKSSHSSDQDQMINCSPGEIITT